MKQNPLERLNVIIAEVERLDKESPAPEGESNPLLEPLLEEGRAIVRQLDPLIRKRYRDEPEKLAGWLSIMNDFADTLAEDEAEKPKTEAAKEAEAAKLAAEIGAVMDRISADLDRFSTRDGPDLELEAVLERSFAALHELDAQVRLRCRDFPEEMAMWEETMELMAEAETRFERGKELEDSEAAN